MQAVRLVRLGEPLEAHEIETPEPGPRDVLVRVKAAGICHSDAHYRAGTSPVDPLPITPGHEVAGVIERTGTDVNRFKAGDRVVIHYMVTCGHCFYCDRGQEQFCAGGKMIGKYMDGGYAEYIRVPARSVFHLPEEVPFAQGAIMMCSSATSLHALNKARIRPGDTVAVFGIGGLGLSAVQLANAMGADKVFAVDIRKNKLNLAASFGAVPVDAQKKDPVGEIRKQTGGRGVDVALELIGLPITMQQAVLSLAVCGRAALAGITRRSFDITPYSDLIGKEAEIIGVSDHLASEIPSLINYACTGRLDLSKVVTATVPLNADRINKVLDELEQFGKSMRTVITPDK